MRKYLVSSILFTTVVALLFVGRSQASVPPAVGSYLSSVKNNEWATIGQAVLGNTPSDISFLKTLSGNTANDYSKAILALTALGKDPRFFGSENLVDGLRQKFNNGQIGDLTLLSDDMFGIIALRASGVPSDDTIISQDAAYIKSKQLADGSWDFSASSSHGSSDLTAMGIMALVAAGVPTNDSAIKNAIDYLQKSQNNDGGWPIQPSGLSNSESTAWVLSAIYALGDNPLFWTPNNNSPIDYLNARLNADGYFLFDEKSTSKDIRTPITTSYVAIALSGKYYPVQIISAPLEVNLRIEGQSNTICETKTQAQSVLDAVKSAATLCNYTYTIEDTQYGPYLKAINSEEASGSRGWSYLVNYDLPQVGMADYSVKNSEDIIIYYGDWGDLPLRLTHSSTMELGASSIATIEKYDYNQKQWLAANGSILKRGNESFTADANGKINLNWTEVGAYQIWVDGVNSVRSAKITVTAGAGSSQSQSLPLTVEIAQSLVNSQKTGNSDPSSANSMNNASAIVFGVSGDLNFGKLKPGESSAKTATITNSSTVPIKITAQVTGARLFVENLSLDEKTPINWQKRLEANTSSASVNTKLIVPADYIGSGKEQGILIFWANPAL